MFIRVAVVKVKSLSALQPLGKELARIVGVNENYYFHIPLAITENTEYMSTL